jgi:hypothetical protein
MRMRWADPRFPITGWIPLVPRFDRPLHVLQRHGGSYPIEKTNSGWVIAGNMVERLQLLENNLSFLAATLAAKTDASLPLESEDFPRPSAYGYARPHRTRMGARISAMRSRDAFFPLVAWCSFVMSSLHYRDENMSIMKWEYYLHEARLPFVSIQEIRQSELVDFSPNYPRAGIFVDYNNVKYEFLARAMVRRGIPVCFCWGNSLPSPPPPVLRLFHPTQTEVAVAFEDEQKRLAYVPTEVGRPEIVQPIQWHTIHDEDSVMPAPSEARPRAWNEPDPLNGQLPGETWEEYFKRMDRIREKVIANESQRSKTQRLDREAANSKRRVLGKKAPPVFMWEEDETTGQLMRKRVDRSQVSDLCYVPDSHWRYNSIANEYDICSAFDPNADEKYSDEDDCCEADFDPTPSESPADQISTSSLGVNASPPPPSTLTPATVPPLPPHPVPSPATLSALQQAPKPSSSQGSTSEPRLCAISAARAAPSSWQDPHAQDYQFADPAEELDFTEMFADILYQRFGFLQPTCMDGLTEFGSSHWSIVRKIYGDTTSFAPSDIQLPASRFQECLLLYKENPHISGQLWDLAQDSNFPLHEHANHLLRVTLRDVGKQTVYFIESRHSEDNHSSWHLMLEDAATVLECFRRPQAIISDIVEYLVSRGRPFSTRIPRRLVQLSPFNRRPGPLATLGWRFLSQPPTIVEYAYYQDLRAQFFRRAHSRAAFLRGGILWRLALESTGRSVEELILDGPSYEVLDCGNSILPVGSNEELWDDNLSESETDLICGVYKIIGK